MRQLTLVIVIATALAIVSATAASAVPLPSEFTFRTIETEHFVIHFHDGFDELARMTADRAERAHRQLAGMLRWTPREPTHIVLEDTSDVTNGWATVLPQNQIHIFPVPPSVEDTIGEYDDWLAMIVTHEYAHILSMDPVRGYSATTRSIFGKPLPSENPFSLLAFIATTPPNVLMPRWWHEGVATWAESLVSNSGRGKGSFGEMVFRMAVAERNFPSIDKINGNVPDWPDGSAPYFFGMRLQRYIAETKGQGAPGTLSIAHAGRFPYFIEDPPVALTGKDYEQLYLSMVDAVATEQRDRIATLQATPLTEVKAFDRKVERARQPRWSPDGTKIAYIGEDTRRAPGLWIADPATGISFPVARLRDGGGGAAWSPDGRWIYLCQPEYVDGTKRYYDLYRIPERGGEPVRLTQGLRVRQPDVAPDGTRIAAIQTGGGSQNVVILEERGGAWRVAKMLTNYRYERISSPRWSPDGTRIAFAHASNDGRSRITVVDVATSGVTTVAERTGALLDPAWSQDGITYVSDQSGVFELYRRKPDGSGQRKLTRLLGGAFQPDSTRDGREIVFSSYHADGFRIERMTATDTPNADAPLPRSPWQAFAGPAEATTSEPGRSTAATAYSPLPTLAPRFWLPTLLADDKGTVLGAFTGAEDVLGRHLFTAEADLGLESNRSYFSFTYANRRWPVWFDLSHVDLPVAYEDLVAASDYWERKDRTTLSLTLPRERIESSFYLTAGYEHERQRSLSPTIAGLFNGWPVFQGVRTGLFATARWTDALGWAHSISPEEGGTVEITHRWFTRDLGGDQDSRETILRLERFLSPSPDRLRHHVIALAAKAGYATGSYAAQNAFAIGGIPDALNEFPVRGYPSRFETGRTAATATAEYRMPLADIFRGRGTTPLFTEKIHGAAFVDAGLVHDSFSRENGGIRTGVGVELRATVVLGYYLRVTPAIGIAQGLDNEGETQLYLTVLSAF